MPSYESNESLYQDENKTFPESDCVSVYWLEKEGFRNISCISFEISIFWSPSLSYEDMVKFSNVEDVNIFRGSHIT